MQVSTREFKTHSYQYFNQLPIGQSFDVISHRKVVAQITGMPAVSGDGPARLLTSGAATWSGGKPAGASVRLGAKGTPVSQIVMADRS